MYVFIESAQRTTTRQAVSATPSQNAVLIIRVIIDSTVLCIVLHTVHRNFQKVQLLVNALGVFGAFYRGHFSHDFRAQGVTLKSKALATKCIFLIQSQLLDISTRLVFKTAEELILPSVCLYVCKVYIFESLCIFVETFIRV